MRIYYVIEYKPLGYPFWDRVKTTYDYSDDAIKTKRTLSKISTTTKCRIIQVTEEILISPKG